MTSEPVHITPLPIEKLNRDTVHLLVGDLTRANRLLNQYIANSTYVEKPKSKTKKSA